MRSQHPVQNETKNRKNQEVIKNDNDDLEVKTYPKKRKTNNGKPKTNLPSFPSCNKTIGYNLTIFIIVKILKIF